MKRGLVLLTLTLAIGLGLSHATETSCENVKAFCIDFNWGEGGPNGFARPGLWADADPNKHVAWYKALGANVIQTFCVSCNGYAWYKGGVVPAQPGLKHDFLTDVVRLGHEEGMTVMGYFCIGANTRWGQAHPNESYGIPAHTHIPFTTDYIDYLCSAVADALTTTGCDGFMVDWFFNGPYNPQHARLKWLACEQQMWTELMEDAFPGKDHITTEQETEFKRRAVERCWTRVRKAAKTANPDCIIWLSCHDLKHPQLVGSRIFKEADWLMNEAGDIATIEATRKMVGPHTKLLTCVVGWGDKHNARELVPAAREANVGVYGFSRPGADSLPLPIATYHASPIDSFTGNDRNIATLARWYKGLPFEAVTTPMPVPSQGQITWHEQERLMFVCLDPATWQGREYDNHTTDFSKPAIAHHTPWHATSEKIAEIKNAMQSNWNPCGTWSQADFKQGSVKLRIDLTGKITEAGQWQVKFTPADPKATLTFSNAVLLQQGQASVPGVLTQSKENPMIWHVNRTAVVTQGTEDIGLTLVLSGEPCAGDIVVRKR
jgi:hypothetical protein